LKRNAAPGILNSLFPVMALFGGNYTPIAGMGPVFSKMADFDPLAWVNRAIFGVIYNQDYSSVFKAVAFCLGISAVFLTAAALLSRKETA
jgi:ABC-2 type transport system permease protein